MLQKRWHSAAGFGLVILMGLGIFVLALTTLPERLQAPFGLTPARTLADASFAADSPEALLAQTKDTDHDGIPDVQELQVYKTSPFLEDSDSDGFRDKEEIETGNDPNCPKGKDCRALAFPSTREVEHQNLLKQLYESSAVLELSKKGVPGISDPASIRNLLRQAEMSEDMLAQLSDEALQKLFEEAATQGGATEGLSFEAPKDSPSSPAQSSLPVNPSPQEIRDLLLNAGMDKEL